MANSPLTLRLSFESRNHNQSQLLKVNSTGRDCSPLGQRFATRPHRSRRPSNLSSNLSNDNSSSLLYANYPLPVHFNLSSPLFMGSNYASCSNLTLLSECSGTYKEDRPIGTPPELPMLSIKKQIASPNNCHFESQRRASISVVSGNARNKCKPGHRPRLRVLTRTSTAPAIPLAAPPPRTSSPSMEANPGYALRVRHFSHSNQHNNIRSQPHSFAKPIVKITPHNPLLRSFSVEMKMSPDSSKNTHAIFSDPRATVPFSDHNLAISSGRNTIKKQVSQESSTGDESEISQSSMDSGYKSPPTAHFTASSRLGQSSNQRIGAPSNGHQRGRIVQSGRVVTESQSPRNRGPKQKVGACDRDYAKELVRFQADNFKKIVDEIWALLDSAEALQSDIECLSNQGRYRYQRTPVTHRKGRGQRLP